MAKSLNCTAKGCAEIVEAPRAFCRAHWDALPKWIKDAIWASHLRRKPNESVTYLDEARRYLATLSSTSRGLAND